MPIDYTQLAQVRAANTANTLLYSSNVGETVQLFVKVANTTQQSADVRIFHDQNGSVWDETTAIVYDLRIAPGDFLEVDHVFVNSPAATLAYRTSLANALTATVYGVVRT